MNEFDFIIKLQQNYTKHRANYQKTIEKYEQYEDNSEEVDWSDLEDEDEDENENQLDLTASFNEEIFSNVDYNYAEQIVTELCNNVKKNLTSTPIHSEKIATSTPIPSELAPKELPSTKNYENNMCVPQITPIKGIVYPININNKPNGSNRDIAPKRNILDLVREKNLINNIKKIKPGNLIEKNKEEDVIVISDDEDTTSEKCLDTSKVDPRFNFQNLIQQQLNESKQKEKINVLVNDSESTIPFINNSMMTSTRVIPNTQPELNPPNSFNDTNSSRIYIPETQMLTKVVPDTQPQPNSSFELGTSTDQRLETSKDLKRSNKDRSKQNDSDFSDDANSKKKFKYCDTLVVLDETRVNTQFAKETVSSANNLAVNLNESMMSIKAVDVSILNSTPLKQANNQQKNNKLQRFESFIDQKVTHNEHIQSLLDLIHSQKSEVHSSTTNININSKKETVNTKKNESDCLMNRNVKNTNQENQISNLKSKNDNNFISINKPNVNINNEISAVSDPFFIIYNTQKQQKNTNNHLVASNNLINQCKNVSKSKNIVHLNQNRPKLANFQNSPNQTSATANFNKTPKQCTQIKNHLASQKTKPKPINYEKSTSILITSSKQFNSPKRNSVSNLISHHNFPHSQVQINQPKSTDLEKNTSTIAKSFSTANTDVKQYNSPKLKTDKNENANILSKSSSILNLTPKQQQDLKKVVKQTPELVKNVNKNLEYKLNQQSFKESNSSRQHLDQSLTTKEKNLIINSSASALNKTYIIPNGSTRNDQKSEIVVQNNKKKCEKESSSNLKQTSTQAEKPAGRKTNLDENDLDKTKCELTNKKASSLNQSKVNIISFIDNDLYDDDDDNDDINQSKANQSDKNTNKIVTSSEDNKSKREDSKKQIEIDLCDDILEIDETICEQPKEKNANSMNKSKKEDTNQNKNSNTLSFIDNDLYDDENEEETTSKAKKILNSTTNLSNKNHSKLVEMLKNETSQPVDKNNLKKDANKSFKFASFVDNDVCANEAKENKKTASVSDILFDDDFFATSGDSPVKSSASSMNTITNTPKTKNFSSSKDKKEIVVVVKRKLTKSESDFQLNRFSSPLMPPPPAPPPLNISSIDSSKQKRKSSTTESKGVFYCGKFIPVVDKQNTSLNEKSLITIKLNNSGVTKSSDSANSSRSSEHSSSDRRKSERFNLQKFVSESFRRSQGKN